MTGDVAWRVTSGGIALAIYLSMALTIRADTLHGALINHITIIRKSIRSARWRGRPTSRCRRRFRRYKPTISATLSTHSVICHRGGEVTGTDIAQTKASCLTGRATVLAAEAQYVRSRANTDMLSHMGGVADDIVAGDCRRS
jgi:hypothetical protein